VNQGGFAAVGNELDGVDEVFAPGAQLADALPSGGRSLISM
jgi:hypothetical protein